MNNVIKQVVISMWSCANSVNASCIILSVCVCVCVHKKMMQSIFGLDSISRIYSVIAYLNVLRKVKSIPSVIVLTNNGRVH